MTIENAYVYVNDIYRTLLRNIEMSHMSLCPNQHFDDTYVPGIYMYKPEPYFSFCIMAALNDLFAVNTDDSRTTDTEFLLVRKSVIGPCFVTVIDLI